MRCITAQPVSLQDIHRDGRERYNSNNHWNDRQPPTDYDQVLRATTTSTWIESFHAREYAVYIIPWREVLWMKKALKVGHMTGTFPVSYQDELDAALERLGETDPVRQFGQRCMVRTESASLKHGVHGAGPYTNMRQVFESLCTSRDGHQPLDDADDEKHRGGLKLYLMPWLDDLEQDKEVRVFVYHRRVTALSQQRVYNVNSWLMQQPLQAETEAQAFALQVLTFVTNKVLPLLNATVADQCTIDLGYRTSSSDCYFIETNPFGAQYQAGSALFHWILDQEVLMNTDPASSVVFRYVTP